MKNFIIFDGNALVHRSYHALPPFKTKKGQMVNAVYGFTAVLIKVIRELKPVYLAATFDLAGPTFRDKEYKEYKAKRVKAPQELYDQFPLVKKVVKAFGIPIYEKQGFEADDIIATICQEAKKEKTIKKIIVTGDMDTLQLVDSRTEIYNLRKGIKDTVVFDKKAIAEKYGLTPKQITDFKALRGDPSDNIPGVAGVGEKIALDLIKKFGDLKKLYQDLEKSDLNPKLKARLLEYKEDAFFSYFLVTLKKDAPIGFNLNDCRWSFGNKKKIIDLLKEFEFKSLIDRLSSL
jgi:DNA polymerase-1